MAPGGKAATRHGVRRGAYSTKGRAWRRRAGDDARAIHGPRAISRSRRAVASHLARVEVDGVERGGFYACAASRSGLGYAVSRRRRDSAFRSSPSRILAVVRFSARSAPLWAGPFCSSRRPSRSASHESGREGWKRAGCIGRLAAHCATRRGIVTAA